MQKLLVTTALGYGLYEAWPHVLLVGYGSEWLLYA